MGIPVHKPFIKRREMDAVLTCLVTDLQTSGSQSSLLVSDCAALLEAKGGLALREYQRGIEVALRALDLPRGGRVGVSALSPPAYGRAIAACGLEAVLVDAGERNPTLSFPALRKLHESAPLQALLVHQSLGYLAEPAITELGLPIIEDISQAFGQAGAGSLGSLILVGLEIDGLITAGGGTLVLARDGGLHNKLTAIGATLGPDLCLSEMNAALGRTQLAGREEAWARRGELAILFNRAVLRGSHKALSTHDDRDPPTYACCVFAQSGVADIVQYARRKQIDTELAFARCLLQEQPEERLAEFPHAYAMILRCLLFPLHPGLRKKDIETIEKVLATLP